MAKVNAPYTNFNGGEIGPEVQARINLEGYGASASILENWLPEVEGPMGIRPGFLFKVQPIEGDPFIFLHPFRYSISQKALLLLSGNQLRISQNGAVLGRTAVSSTVPNGDFGASGTWTDASTGSGNLANAHTSLAGRAALRAGLGGRAALRNVVTTSSVGVQHVLNIDVDRGPVTVRVGSAAGAFDYLNFSARTGHHSIAFVPTASPYHIEISTTERVTRIVNFIEVAGAGDMVLETPWPESVLPSLRFAQRNDVIYVASGVGPMQRIERRGPSSWSIVDTDERDGPFLPPNLDTTIRLDPSATSGNITMSSTVALFASSHVGALFQLTHAGQSVSAALAALDDVTDAIVVQGVGDDRIFNYTITGTWTGTIRLQRSVGNNVAFADTSTTRTSNISNAAFDDGLDNQLIYYRFTASAWTSGTATVTITYSGGTTVGVVRITSVASSTSVNAEVLKPLGSADATAIWSEGAWSDAAYWPKGIGFADQRLWSMTEDRLWISRPDDFENHAFSDDDASAISGPLATGDASPAQWILGLSRVVMGTEGAEIMARESTQDGKITAANITLREYGTYGSADVSPAKVDTQAISVDRSTWRVLQHAFDVNVQNYVVSSLMRLHRNLGKPGIRQLAVSRQPETRLWMVRTDGVLLTKSFNPTEAVLGWSRVITDGEVESVAVLPGDASTGEDEVWIIVARTVDGDTVRYLELMDKYYYDSAAEANRLDSSVYYDGAPETTFTALHLRGRSIRIWGDGARLPDRVVDPVTGQFTTSKAVSKCVYGLTYTARYQSSRLALGAQAGSALGQQGRTLNIIIGLLDSVANLFYGDTFDKMDPLKDRLTYDSAYDTGPGLRSGETDPLPMPNKTGTNRNPMLCLKAESPGPVRVAYFVLAHLLKERVG